MTKLLRVLVIGLVCVCSSAEDEFMRSSQGVRCVAADVFRLKSRRSVLCREKAFTIFVWLPVECFHAAVSCGWSLLPRCSFLAALCVSATLPDMCVRRYKVHLRHFSFSSRRSYLFWSPSSLFLFALDLLEANVCIPELLRKVATNKEDYCLSSCFVFFLFHLWSYVPEWLTTHLSHLFSGSVLSPCIPEEDKWVPPKAAEWPQSKKGWGQNQ